MTQDRDLKRLIRARMAKTGESYTTARSHLLRNRPQAQDATSSPTLVPQVRPAAAPRRPQPVRIRQRLAGLPRRQALRLEWLPVALSTPAVLLVILAAVVGCAPREPEATTVHVRDNEGVQIVENLPAGLAGAEVWPLSTEPVLEIGGGSSPEAALYLVTDVALLPDGRVAVGMNAPAQVLVFSEAGALQATLGRPGEGPGEFTSVGSVVPLGADSVAVWDPDRRRLSVYHTDGRLLREMDLRDVAPLSTGAAPSMDVASGMTRLLPAAGGGFIIFAEGVTTSQATAGVGRATLPSIRISADGTRVAEYGPFAGMEWVGGGPAGALPLPLGARTYGAAVNGAAVNGGRALVVGTADTTEFRVYGEDGALVRVVRWPDTDRTARGPHLARWTGFVQQAEPPIRELVEAMPRRERFPAYDAIIATEDGGVAVASWAGPIGIWPLTRADQAPELMRPAARVPPRRWLVFNSDGVLSAIFETPEGFEPYVAAHGRIWGVYSDTMDVESVRAYTLQ